MMDIDEQIIIAEDRLRKLKDLKIQLEAVLGTRGVTLEKKHKLCKNCGALGHQARTCTAPPSQKVTPTKNEGDEHGN
jgi:hypothetical protein